MTCRAGQVQVRDAMSPETIPTPPRCFTQQHSGTPITNPPTIRPYIKLLPQTPTKKLHAFGSCSPPLPSPTTCKSPGILALQKIMHTPPHLQNLKHTHHHPQELLSVLALSDHLHASGPRASGAVGGPVGPAGAHPASRMSVRTRRLRVAPIKHGRVPIKHGHFPIINRSF